MQRIKFDELVSVFELAKSLLDVSDRCAKGPWKVALPEDMHRVQRGQYLITADEAWRRRPPNSKSAEQQTWNELSDVATVSGGMLPQAVAHGHFIALCRDAAPALAQFVLKMAGPLCAAEFQQATEEAAKDERCTGSTSLLIGSPWLAIYVFLEDLANAVDRLFETAGGRSMGFAVSNRNDEPIGRLLSGGADGREQRWEVLSNIVGLIDPAFDRKRLKELPAGSRVEWNGRPDQEDFYQAIPRLLREAMRGGSVMATNEEAEADLRRAITGKSNPTDDEIAAGLRVLRCRIATAKAE